MGSQARGIGHAAAFHMAPTNEMYEAQWERYRGDSERWYNGVPVVYDGDYRPERMGVLGLKSPWFDAFRGVRDRADVLMFSSVHASGSARHLTAGKGELIVLLRGLAMVRDRQPDRRVVLMTFEYGRQVRDSRQTDPRARLGGSRLLVPDDGAPGPDARPCDGRHRVRRVREQLDRKRLSCTRRSLSENPSSRTAMNRCTPRRRLALYPIVNAQEPEEIADGIEEAIREPARLAAIGTAGREVALTELVSRAMARYLDRIGHASA